MKLLLKPNVFILLIVMTFISCDKSTDPFKETDIPPDTMMDQDGNLYLIEEIGDQIWMAENLRVTHYRNGDPIRRVEEPNAWRGLTKGAYCVYGNSEDHAGVYGYLYNWYAVDDSRQVAPDGWRVPTDQDWKELEMVLGMSQEKADHDRNRGTQGGMMKVPGTTHWVTPNKGATNVSGFSALPGGYREGNDGSFKSIGEHAWFWTSTQYLKEGAWARRLYYAGISITRIDRDERNGFSIRLVRDKGGEVRSIGLE